jgi:signal transduction histidine kinase
LDGVGKHYKVDYSFEVAELNELFPPEAQIVIYRIFQECLTNISKHAGASEVTAWIKEMDGLVSLVLQDNGVGFDVAEILARGASDRGLGLAALYERARMLGGALEISTRKGGGTRITCKIPVNKLKES